MSVGKRTDIQVPKPQMSWNLSWYAEHLTLDRKQHNALWLFLQIRDAVIFGTRFWKLGDPPIDAFKYFKCVIWVEPLGVFFLWCADVRIIASYTYAGLTQFTILTPSLQANDRSPYYARFNIHVRWLCLSPVMILLFLNFFVWMGACLNTNVCGRGKTLHSWRYVTLCSANNR